MTELAKFVRSIRAQLGLKQGEVAKKSGISQPVLSRIESGKIKNPRVETMSRLSLALDIPVQELSRKIEKAQLAPGILNDYFYAVWLENQFDGKTVLLQFAIKPKSLTKVVQWFSYHEGFWINVAHNVSALRITVRVPPSFHDRSTLDWLVNHQIKNDLGDALLKQGTM